MIFNALKELTLKRLGGGGLKGPPLDISRDYSATRKALAAITLYVLFSFEFPAQFDTKFVTPGGTILKLRRLFVHARRTDYGSKCDLLCTKSMQI